LGGRHRQEREEREGTKVVSSGGRRGRADANGRAARVCTDADLEVVQEVGLPDTDAALQQRQMMAPPPPPSPLPPLPPQQAPQQALPSQVGCGSFQAISDIAHKQEQQLMMQRKLVEKERQRRQQRYRAQIEELKRQLEQDLNSLDKKLDSMDKELKAMEEVKQMMRNRSNG